MQNTGKVKLYKNPQRNKPTNLKPYVPQYQIMGVEPAAFHSKTEMGTPPLVLKKAPLSTDNPSAPRPLIQQPYAEPAPSPIGRGRGLLPNVGNNMEQTWSSVDSEIIDDINLDPEHPMVDNNEFVSDEALGLPPQPDTDPAMMEVMEVDLPEEEKSFLSENELQDALKEEYLSAVVQNLTEEEYLLVVNGEAVCSGPLEEIQEQTRGLVFGEHPLCGGNPMPIDDIVVLKRVIIKIGLFLE